MGKLVTAWRIWDKKKRKFKHNHIEDGHSELAKPEPKSEQQKSWLGAKWEKQLCVLVENNKVEPWSEDSKKEK